MGWYRDKFKVPKMQVVSFFLDVRSSFLRELPHVFHPSKFVPKLSLGKAIQGKIKSFLIAMEAL